MAGMSWNTTGHEWAAEMLQQHIASGSLRHAYLFSGPRGVGRRTLALRFAQAINCPQPLSPGQPCGECRICLQIENMQQADLSILQAEDEGGTLKVEQVRELQHMLSLTPYESKYRVALLLRFEEANANAQNALLKTLEEPNSHVVLLVTADDPENLLPTIVSRCELMRLRPMPADALAAHLNQNHNLDNERAELIARISGGRPGLALRLVQDESLLVSRKEYMQDCLNLLDNERIERMLFVEKLTRGRERAEAKSELRTELSYWLSLWRDVLLVSLGSDVLLTNPDYRLEIQRIASQVTNQKAAQLVADLEHSFIRLNTANLQVMLDNILLAWPQLGA